MSEIGSATQYSVASDSFRLAIDTLRSLPVPFPSSPPPLKLGRLCDGNSRPGFLDDGGVEFNGGAPLSAGVFEASRRIRTGELAPEELMEQCLDAQTRAAELGAIAFLDEENCRNQAEAMGEQARQGKFKGPLHGIPITVKDIIHVSGMPTRAGSKAYAEFPEEDSGAVALLREAGAIVMAKVATHEFALGVTTPQCSHPLDPNRISGGSSGGSAIASVVGFGMASIGTDTRASLRVPASLCGVVGFKPTFGLVPVDGIVPLSWTIDHIGPIAPTVSDAACIMNILLGREITKQPGPSSVVGLTVGVSPGILHESDDEVGSAVERALSVLSSIGCRIVEVDWIGPSDLEISNALGLLISRSEAAAFHRAQGTDLSLCIPEVRDQLEAGLGVSAVDYLESQRQRSILAGKVMRVFDECDLFVSASSPVVAPLKSDYERYLLKLSRNTIIWSLLGVPALSMPCGYGSETGLPVGLQVVGPPLSEELVARLGMTLEATDAFGGSVGEGAREQGT